MSLRSSRRGFLAGATTSLFAPQTAAAAAGGGAAGDDAARIPFLQAGAAAVSRSVQDKLRELISVKDFGATGNGTSDDTAAFQAAIDDAGTAAGAYTSILIPPGVYRITDAIRLNKKHIRLFGVGDRSCLYFDPPETGRIMLLVQHSDPAQYINFIVLESFAIRASQAASTHLKTAIKLIDAGSTVIKNVNVVDYSWMGGGGQGSIGIHMCGRDTHQIIGCVIVADAPVFADRNPNSTQFTFDYHHFSGLYLETRKASNYAITFAPGVNPSNWIVDGNTGAFTGKGGIYLNNQGMRTETSSMIRISHFRVEAGRASGGGTGGYGIYMDFGTGNPACANLMIENCSVNDPTCNGYRLKNISALVATNINCGFAAGNDAFVCTDVINAYITSLGIGHPAARVQMNGMQAQVLHKFAGATEASPSIAFAIFSNDAANSPATNLVYEYGIRKWSRTQVMSNGEEMLLPVIAAGGSMMVNVSSDFGAAIYSATPANTFQLSATPEWSGKVGLESDGAGNIRLRNLRAGTHRFIVTTQGS